MTDLTDLRALYEAVKAGADEIDTLPAFPVMEHRSLLALALTPGDLRAMGAALAFMGAVLTKQTGWVIDTADGVTLAHVYFTNNSVHSGESADPARALVLAVLAAMIAEAT